jgi:dihydrolipoamide dehydrogenase
MRTNMPHIFAIGDIIGQPMLAQKAVYEGHVAAEVIAGEQQGSIEQAAAAFNARVTPSDAYTDPEVDRVGQTEAHGHGKILGGGIVGQHAGYMIGEIALAIEMGADAVDIGKTIHPHPKLGESIGIAAEIAHGSCMDVPPVRK